jgi:hypothetical protein
MEDESKKVSALLIIALMLVIFSVNLLGGQKHKKDKQPAVPPAGSAEPSVAEAITELKAEVAALKAQMAELQKKGNAPVELPAPVERQAASLNLAAVAVLPASTPVIPAAVVTAKPPVQSQDPPPPLQFKIGDATITPIGFMDLTNTWRSSNSGTSLQTNFGSIPYNNTLAGHLTEDKLSAANSRIGFRVDARLKDTSILGYYEGDFVGGIGNAAFNTQVSSNSLLYRIRLYWVDARKGNFEMLAGQSWSMMTPNRKQISAIPADLFYSQVVDVNYMNGLTWGRIPGIRFLYHAGEKTTIGVSLENAAQYFGGSGGGGTPTLPAAFTSAIVPELDENVANGVATPNVHPDVISKIAFDPSSRAHFEAVGVESTVRLFNPVTQQHFTKAGVGGSLNGNFEIVKNLRVVSNNFWSDGEGRYMFGVAPNFIVRADGSPSMIHSGSSVSGLEYQRKNTQLYAYYGGVYISRNTALDTNGAPIGYGYAGSPNSQNRTIQEGTFGFTQTAWRDAKYGAMQWMMQYAYFVRNPWSVAPGAPKNAHQNAIWFNLRYVLPGTPPPAKTP